MKKEVIQLAQLRALATINHDPDKHRELVTVLADLFGGASEQSAADAWMFVASAIAGGKHPPSDEFDGRVKEALLASSEAFKRLAGAIDKAKIARDQAKKQPAKAAANGSEGQAPSPN